jgi:hypothetical protein
MKTKFILGLSEIIMRAMYVNKMQVVTKHVTTDESIKGETNYFVK